MTPPPAWFSAALDAAVQEGATTVDGASIAYRDWGDPDRRSIVLVHCGAATSRWWDPVAPMLTDGWRVAAVDLSGHGDSDRRDRYSLDTWAREVLAVVAETGSAAASVVIGHSMGGLVTLRLATLAGSQIAGAVAIDSPVRDMAPEDRAARQHRAFGPLRVYPTRETAIARFRPIPDQPVLAWVAAHVAATSIRPAEGGWTWKFDPQVFTRDHLTPELLTRLDCRVALLRGDQAVFGPEQRDPAVEPGQQLGGEMIPGEDVRVELPRPAAFGRADRGRGHVVRDVGQRRLIGDRAEAGHRRLGSRID